MAKHYNCAVCNKRTKPNNRRTVSKLVKRHLQKKLFIYPDANDIICSACSRKFYRICDNDRVTMATAASGGSDSRMPKPVVIEGYQVFKESEGQPGVMMIKQEPVDPEYRMEHQADAQGGEATTSATSVREQLIQMVENQGKDLTVKSVVEDLLKRNEFILAQNNAQPLKPHTRTVKPKQTESEENSLGTVLQPKDPTVSCTKDDITNINEAVVEVAVTDKDATNNETDLVCAVGSKIMLLTPQGQPLLMDLTCFWCNFCSFKSDKKEGLLQHVMEHRFHCKYCKFQSFSRAAVIQHGVQEHQNFMETASTLKFCIYLPDILQRNELKKRKAKDSEEKSGTKKRKTDNDEIEAPLNMEVEEVDESKDTETSAVSIVTPSKKATARKSLPAPTNKNFVKLTTRSSKTAAAEVPKSTPEEKEVMPIITNVISGHEAVTAAGGITTPQKIAPKPHLSKILMEGTPPAAPPPAAAVPPSGDTGSVDASSSTGMSSGLCWNCGYCGFVTLSQAFLKIHLNASHQGKSHKYVAMLVSSEVEMARIKASDLQLSKDPIEKAVSNYTKFPTDTAVASSSSSSSSGENLVNSTQSSNQSVGIEIDNAEIDSAKLKDESEEEKKIPVSFKCAHCNYSAPKSEKVKSHLFQRHSGCVMYALDMKAVKLRQKRYVFFCLKSKCNFETKDVNDFLDHCEGCTPWLEGKECAAADSSMIKSLEMTKQFIIKTQATVSGQSKEFRFDRITAEYGCDYCSYISNNNTRLKKHVLSIHANKNCVIRDLQAEKNQRKPTVYFCLHCLWETREGGELEMHLKKSHDSESSIVTPNSSATSTIQAAAQPATVTTPETVTAASSSSAAYTPASKPAATERKAKATANDRGGSSETSPSPSDKSSEKDEDEDLDLTDIYAGIVSNVDIAKAMKEYVEGEKSPNRARGRPSRTAAVQARMKNKLTKPPSLYRCVHCKVIAFGTKLMRKHLKLNHKNQPLYATDVLKHAKKPHESEKVFFCPDGECSYSSALNVDVEQHAKSTHGLKADNADLILMSRVPVVVCHLLRSPDGGQVSTTGESYECLYCSDSQVFYTRHNMKNHLRSTHPKEPLIYRDCIARKLKQPSRFFLCAESSCEYTSEKEKNCTLHALAHTKTRIQECSKCQWFTSVQKEMAAHQKEKHPGERSLTLLVDLDIDSQGHLVKLVNGTVIKAEQE